MYSPMSSFQLRAELRRRAASTAGGKAILIKRLEANDRIVTSNDQRNLIFECPSSGSFRDINAKSPLPNISKHDIQDYFEKFNAKPRGQYLYETRHLVTAQFATSGGYTFIRGVCKDNKKKLTYELYVKLNVNGSVEGAHCKCSVGSDTMAHCKHLAVLLCGLHDICNKKYIILLNEGRFQPFKKPRKVYDSPIKVHKLPQESKRKLDYHALNENDIINNYGDYVRNLVIGFGKSTMPFLQTIEPANPYAIEWDHHSYSKKTPKDKLLEKLLLKDVTHDQIQLTEENSRGQSSNPKWHMLKSCRIMANMFHIVCWHNTSDTTKILKKIMSPKQLHTRPAIHRKVHEPVAILKYENMYRLTVEKCGMFISTEYPFLAATPDGLVGKDAVIEVKCPYPSRNSKINSITVPYLQNINGVLSLKQNHPYYAEIQGNLYCTRKKKCILIIYTFLDLKVIVVFRNDSFINALVADLINFYNHHLEPAIFNKYIYKDYDNIIKNKL